MKKILFAFAVSSLALAACGERAADTNDTTTTADGTVATTDNTGMVTDDQAAVNATPMNTTGDGTNSGDAQEYINQAASSDMYEIQSSELAVEKARSPAVRQFAQQMITDHRASTQKLQTAATGSNLQAPPTEMMPAHRAKLEELREATGPAFDERYIEQQREAHKQAIDMHEAMTRTQNAPAQMAAFARETLPVVQGHARMLETMKTND